jgi:hypothetical protein
MRGLKVIFRGMNAPFDVDLNQYLTCVQNFRSFVLSVSPG